MKVFFVIAGLTFLVFAFLDIFHILKPDAYTAAALANLALATIYFHKARKSQ